MSENVTFEGMIRISGSIAKVEKILGTIRKGGAEIVDDSGYHHGWPRLKPIFTNGGMTMSVELGAFMRDARFVRNRISAYNRTVPVKSRVRFRLWPDFGIYGGRKYPHLHFGDMFLPMNEEALGGVIIEGLKELQGLGVGNQIR